MHVDVIPNRGSPPAILLRESYREDGKTKKRTLANLSDWPAERIEQLRAVLRGERLLPAGDAVEIVRALPHGHVLAALGIARRIELDALLPRRAPQRRRDLALALIIARVLEPAAKLATARMLDPSTASHSLGETLGLGHVTAKDVYATLDWLGREQSFIETILARRHLNNGALLLYDVTSTYLEGRCCELAQYGYSRDHRRDRPQLVIGLLCAADGCPVAVEVFDGNTADPMTLASQIDKLKQRFRLQRVVMVGDRGMLTSARIEQTLRPAGHRLDHRLASSGDQAIGRRGWAIAAVAVRSSRHGRDHQPRLSRRAPGGLQEPAPGRGAHAQAGRVAGSYREGTDPHPGPRAAAEQAAARRRGDRPGGRRSVGPAQDGQAFQITISDEAISFARNDAAIGAEAALDGIPRVRPKAGSRTCYVVRTNLPATQSDTAATVRAYKSLSRRGARLPIDQDRRSGIAPSVPLDRAAGARTRAAVHAGLLSGMAHASAPGADAVRRTRSGGTRGATRLAGGEGQALASRAAQGRQQAHRSRARRTAAGA